MGALRVCSYQLQIVPDHIQTGMAENHLEGNDISIIMQVCYIISNLQGNSADIFHERSD